MTDQKILPDSCFIVLALLSEGDIHGYELEKQVFNRGFRFWAQLGRSSIYNSLRMLEKSGLVKSRSKEGGGPNRKVFSVTKAGLQRLRKEGYKHLASPSHWRSELDLGLYALPLFDVEEGRKAFTETLGCLENRLKFIRERLKWCRDRELELPALSFERTATMLEAEIEWLKGVRKRIAARKEPFTYEEWQKYEYQEPPAAEIL